MPLENVNNALVGADMSIKPDQASVNFLQRIFDAGPDPLCVNFAKVAGEEPMTSWGIDMQGWMNSLIVARLARDGQPFTLDFSGHALDYDTVTAFYHAAYNGVNDGNYLATGLTLKINGGTNDPGDTAAAADAVIRGWTVLHN